MQRPSKPSPGLAVHGTSPALWCCTPRSPTAGWRKRTPPLLGLPNRFTRSTRPREETGDELGVGHLLELGRAVVGRACSCAGSPVESRGREGSEGSQSATSVGHQFACSRSPVGLRRRDSRPPTLQVPASCSRLQPSAKSKSRRDKPSQRNSVVLRGPTRSPNLVTANGANKSSGGAALLVEIQRSRRIRRRRNGPPRRHPPADGGNRLDEENTSTIVTGRPGPDPLGHRNLGRRANVGRPFSPTPEDPSRLLTDNDGGPPRPPIRTIA